MYDLKGMGITGTRGVREGHETSLYETIIKRISKIKGREEHEGERGAETRVVARGYDRIHLPHPAPIPQLPTKTQICGKITN